MLVRLLSAELLNGYILLFRSGTQLLIVVAWVLFVASPRVLVSGRFAMHALRGSLSAVAWWVQAMSVRMLDLTLSTLLGFTSQIFLVAMAGPLLKERVTSARLIATLVGFAGIPVAIGLGIGGPGLDLGAAYGLVGALMGAVILVITRSLAQTERIEPILFYMAAFVFASAVPQVLWSGTFPSPRDLTLLIVLSFIGSIGTFLMVMAYRVAEASALAPYPYLRFIFAAALGVVVFGEPVTLRLVLGALLIICSSLYLMLAERR